MGICDECSYFRGPRPPSQLLAAAFTVNSSEVTEALGKVQEDEKKIREGELDIKRSLITAGKEAWMGRPVMSGFCGFKEATGAFLIAEVKNAGGGCTDISTDPPSPKSCSTCAHRVLPVGDAADVQRQAVFVNMSERATAAQAQDKTGEEGLSEHRKAVASLKGIEIGRAYDTDGHVSTRPNYLAYCSAFSSETNFRICVLQNRWDVCDRWTAASNAPEVTAPQAKEEGSAMSMPTPDATRPTAPDTVTGPNPAALLLGGIASAMSVGAVSAPPNPNDVLAPGDPPLTRGLLGKIVGTFEWVFDVRLPPADRALFENAVVAGCIQDPGSGLANYQSVLDLHASVPATDAAANAQLRERIQPQIVQVFRQQSDPVSEMFVRVYDAANAPLAPGVPPLTQEMVDNFIEILVVVNEFRLFRTIQPLSAAERTQFSQQLASRYPGYAPPVQAFFGNLPSGWADLRYQLATAIADTKDQLIASLDATITAAGLIGPPPPGSRGAPPFSVPTNDPGQDYGLPTSWVLRDKVQPDPLADIFARDMAEVEEMRKTDPELALQMENAARARHTTMVSDSFKSHSQAIDHIAENFR